METSRPLSIESFSYSWLINLQPSLESLDSLVRASSVDACDDAAFIEMDPKMTPSKRFIIGDAQNFNFDFPVSQSPLTVVHADELFSNGLLMPLFVDPTKVDSCYTSDSVSSPTVSSKSSKDICSTDRIHTGPFLRRCRKSSKRIFQKYLCFLNPVNRKEQGSRTSNRAEATESRVSMITSRPVSSQQSSPRPSTAYSTGDWRDIECLIYEAVLHCKKSIEA